MLNHKVMFSDPNIQYICELRIDGKIKDKKKTSDYEAWYDNITDKVYELNGFMEIEIKIHVSNSRKLHFNLKKNQKEVI